ncbi:MAG TPA: metallophosphoesterase [Vicinamibacterales bacterium]|nr:metallophosphoesterase [Vicinamibacterales bacterium]
MSPHILPLGRVIATLGAAFVLTTAAAGVEPQGRAAAPVDQTQAPRAVDSIRFAVLGDVGTGGRSQYEVGTQVARSLATFPFEFVLLLGDNIYGSERPQDFSKKFEKPYEAILSRKIPFYAALGNHDDPNQRYYKPFNMNGERFYTFRKKDAQFFALDSNYMDKVQRDWLAKELSASNAKWKIAFFHHPLYSSGATHGSEVDLRDVVEPLFIKHGVGVVFAGHEHFYERVKPQRGIHYFTSGSAGKLREGNIRVGGPLTAKGFDTDFSYMLIEIDGQQMHFQTLSRAGKMVDSGSFSPDAVSGGSRSGGARR